MSDQEQPSIRMWTWATMPPVGKRAYVLKMALNLLRKHEIPVPEAWANAWAAAARALWQASPKEADDVTTLSADDVPTDARMSEPDWTRLRSLEADAPLDEALVHKAAIEYVLHDYGGAVPAELVEITLALG